MVNEEQEKWKKLIKSAAFFRSFGDEELDELITYVVLKKYREDEFIVKEKTKGESFFILLKGKALIQKMNELSVPLRVAALKSGDCFGEMSIVLNQPRSASIVASEPCFVIEVELHKIDTMPAKIQLKLYRQFSINLAKRLQGGSSSPEPS